MSSISYKIETTLQTLESYNVLDHNNRQKNDKLLAVRTQKSGGHQEEFLTKINRSDVTYWNLFLKFFNCGALAYTEISIKNIESHLTKIFESRNFTADHKMDCCSQAYKTVCKIRDWAEKKGSTKLDQFVSSTFDFMVQGVEHYPYIISYFFDSPGLITNSILTCEQELEKDAIQRRQRTVNEIEKYYLDCRDVVSFEATEERLQATSWENYLSHGRIKVGPKYGTYIQNSARYQLAKILKQSDHQGNARRKPGQIIDPLVVQRLMLVDVQRLSGRQFLRGPTFTQ